MTAYEGFKIVSDNSHKFDRFYQVDIEAMPKDRVKKFMLDLNIQPLDVQGGINLDDPGKCNYTFLFEDKDASRIEKMVRLHFPGAPDLSVNFGFYYNKKR